MNAMKCDVQYNLLKNIRLEAISYCRRLNLPDDSIDKAYEFLRISHYMNEIDDLQKAKARLYKLAIPKVVFNNGLVDICYDFSGDCGKAVSAIDNHIEHVKRKYFPD